jgi:hypothetical protein
VRWRVRGWDGSDRGDKKWRRRRAEGSIACDVRDGLRGVVDNHPVVRGAGTIIVMVMGDLLHMQKGMAIAAVPYQKALRSDSQALETKADQQQS